MIKLEHQVKIGQTIASHFIKDDGTHELIIVNESKGIQIEVNIDC